MAVYVPVIFPVLPHKKNNRTQQEGKSKTTQTPSTTSEKKNYISDIPNFSSFLLV